MRILLLIAFVGSFTLFGCDDIEPKIYREIPANLIEKVKMVNVLYDLQLTQSAYKGRSHNDTIAEQTRNYRTIKLLESHNISQPEFESSLEYYHQSPNDMEDIYREVITKLNLKIAQLEEKID